MSPYKEDRDYVRALFPEGDFVEVYVKVSLTEAERRDPKELYQKARAGEIFGFTGVDAPYEEPTSSELVLDTAVLSINSAISERDRLLGGDRDRDT